MKSITWIALAVLVVFAFKRQLPELVRYVKMERM